MFISREFTNWKDGTVSFTKHESSDCHKEAVQVMKVLPCTKQNIGEQLRQIYAANKSMNRKMLLKILQNIKYLARQSIGLRGVGDESDSNFIQLLHLRACDDPRVEDLIKKKANKYTSRDSQQNAGGNGLAGSKKIGITTTTDQMSALIPLIMNNL